MERFIAEYPYTSHPVSVEFKIQYGEIYSKDGEMFWLKLIRFKIQYGEIYRRNYVSKS